MRFRCSTCGFQATEPTFFRREKGGLFNIRKTVCEACVPYRPNIREAKFGRAILSGYLFSVVFGIFFSHGDDAWLFILVFLIAATINLPLRIAVHEAGHAFAAKAVGGTVWLAQIGSGPVVCRIAFAGIPFEVRRYFHGGGMVKLLPLGDRHFPLHRALVVAGGPLANLALAFLALGGAWICSTKGEPTLPFTLACLQIGATNMLTVVENLLPHSVKTVSGETLPSDGQQLLALLQSGGRPDPLMQKMYTVWGLTRLGRYEDAINAAGDDWGDTSLKAFFASNILHNLSRSRGDRAALEFYMRHKEALQESRDTAAEGDSRLPWIAANVAWSAVKLGDPAFGGLAEKMAAAAMTAQPEDAEMQGTYGAWLVSVERPAEGLPLLTQAARRMDNSIDKADFCRFLARGWRLTGDNQRASLYEDLSLFYAAKPR